MAGFPPRLFDPTDPNSIQAWADDVTSLLSGQLSIGEPISANTALMPNGVKGHMLGSFVTVVVGQGYAIGAQVPCVHNLDIPNKGTATYTLTTPTDLNVGWVPVRWEHDAAGCLGAGIETVSCIYEGGTVTANSIELVFYAAGPRTVIQESPLFVTLWFFPATR